MIVATIETCCGCLQVSHQNAHQGAQPSFARSFDIVDANHDGVVTRAEWHAAGLSVDTSLPPRVSSQQALKRTPEQLAHRNDAEEAVRMEISALQAARRRG